MKIEVSAKTIEKAIEEGLKQLNTTIENVDVNVICDGGLFKKAKIEMSLSEEKPEKKEVKKAEVKAEKPKKEVKKEEKKEVEEPKTVEPVVEEQLEEQPTVEDKQQKKQEAMEQTIKFAKEWLDGFIYTLNIPATVNFETRENGVYCSIDGENLGILIGYHGEAMEAIQQVLNAYLYNKHLGLKRVFVDVCGYKNKKCEDLKSMAEKLAQKVLDNHNKYKLDPMNSYERRIVHEELSNKPHITTHSEGVEPNRYLIIEWVD